MGKGWSTLNRECATKARRDLSPELVGHNIHDSAFIELSILSN